jgi:hypothetical protein
VKVVTGGTWCPHSTVLNSDRLDTNLWSSWHAVLVVLTQHVVAMYTGDIVGLGFAW